MNLLTLPSQPAGPGQPEGPREGTLQRVIPIMFDQLGLERDWLYSPQFDGLTWIGAVVVECTNIAPYSAELRERSGLPVFDIVTLARWLAAAVRPARYPSHPIAR